MPNPAVYFNYMSVASTALVLLNLAFLIYLLRAGSRVVSHSWLVGFFACAGLYQFFLFVAVSVPYWGNLFYPLQIILVTVALAALLQFARTFPDTSSDRARRRGSFFSRSASCW